MAMKPTQIKPQEAINSSPLQAKKIRDQKLIADLKKHFWCDFSDIIPSLTWDDTDQPN